MTTPAEKLPFPLSEEKKTSRIAARVPLLVKETIDMAAELSGETTNQFMAQAAYQAAKTLLEQERMVRLSAIETTQLLDLLDNSPAPSKKIKQALAAYQASALNVKN